MAVINTPSAMQSEKAKAHCLIFELLEKALQKR
jgi:hypothetical protein